MHILLTRPHEDAVATASELIALGHEVSLAPMLRIAFLSPSLPDPSRVQAIAVSSRNGVRGFTALNPPAPWWQKPVYAVGQATATAAAAAGFREVRYGDGDIKALAALLVTDCCPSSGTILHLSGADVAGDLKTLLSTADFDITRFVLYKAERARRLTDDIVAKLAGRQVDAVMFFSPRSAEAFVRVVRVQRLETLLQTLDAYCLSRAVAEQAQNLTWHKVHVAATPRRASLIDLVRNRD